MVAPVIVGGLLSLGTSLVERLFPDPEQQDKAKLELLKLQQSGELQKLESETRLAMGQLAVNKAEAEAGPYRGGWRPFIGWVGGFGLAYQYVVRPLLSFVLVLNDIHVELPVLEVDEILTLLFGMLGLGAYRSYEKVKGLG